MLARRGKSSNFVLVCKDAYCHGIKEIYGKRRGKVMRWSLDVTVPLERDHPAKPIIQVHIKIG